VFFSPERATTAAQAAAGFTVLLLPYSLIGPFTGPLLDYWRRTRVLAICNGLRALLVGAVAALLIATGPSLGLAIRHLATAAAAALVLPDTGKSYRCWPPSPPATRWSLSATRPSPEQVEPQFYAAGELTNPAGMRAKSRNSCSE
jgi:MFS family permease